MCAARPAAQCRGSRVTKRARTLGVLASLLALLAVTQLACKQQDVWGLCLSDY